MANTIPSFPVLSELDIGAEDVLQEVRWARVGRFGFDVDLAVVLPLMISNLPLFGKISNIYVLNEDVYIVTKDLKTVEYSVKFVA